MIKTTIYLDEQTHQTIKQFAKFQGKSQAELIRQALEQYASQIPIPKPQGIGKYRSGRNDISQNEETILKKALRHKQ